jgi:hypothetical protein
MTEGLPTREVVVLSYFNDPNFGDRLGYHLVNAVLPPDARVTHCSVKPWTVPDRPIDLLVIGIGNSLNAATVLRPELFELVDRARHSVGIFGTQYRHQFARYMPADRFPRLLDRLTCWFARHRRDLDEFGRGRPGEMHLGDWLVTAFPMARWSDDRTLRIPPEVKRQELPLDRVIQRIQRHRRVYSARLHPLLCALTSAEEVAYTEQREDPESAKSGKFAAMFEDIFGCDPPPNRFFEVDRGAVVAYKRKVAANVEAMRATLAELLDEG